MKDPKKTCRQSRFNLQIRLRITHGKKVIAGEDDGHGCCSARVLLVDGARDQVRSPNTRISLGTRGRAPERKAR